MQNAAETKAQRERDFHNELIETFNGQETTVSASTGATTPELSYQTLNDGLPMKWNGVVIFPIYRVLRSKSFNQFIIILLDMHFAGLIASRELCYSLYCSS